jgi:hypothetical protein
MADRLTGLARRAAVVLCWLACAGAQAARAAQDPVPEGPPACTPQADAALRRGILALAGTEKPEEAWQLAHTFLCTPAPRALPILLEASATPFTHKIDDPSGEELRSVSDIAGELRSMLPHGRVWNPEARREKDRLVVYYAIDANCWNFFGMRFAGQRWRLVLSGGGCD